MNSVGGYKFKNATLMQTALTHSSFSARNYERLEFLGDSILDFLIADVLFKNNSLSEQELTRARANIVSEQNLSEVFNTLNLESMVKLGKSLKKVTNAIKCDVVESIIGAIYLESGLEECYKFVNKNFNIKVEQAKDYKTQFQEFAQKHKYTYEYILTKTEGPAHALTFYITLMVNGKEVSSAVASNKLIAEKECAQKALKIMQK